MNKKGFTLVELLLVLVIIGIIGVLTIPRIMESLKESKAAGGDATEKLLLDNLELYNEDNKYDIWKDDTSDVNTCKSVTLTELKTTNPDIKLGECKLNDGNNSLIIKKIEKNKYQYYVKIICGKNLPAGDYYSGTPNKADYYYQTKSTNPCE